MATPSDYDRLYRELSAQVLSELPSVLIAKSSQPICDTSSPSISEPSTPQSLLRIPVKNSPLMNGGCNVAPCSADMEHVEIGSTSAGSDERSGSESTGDDTSGKGFLMEGSLLEDELDHLDEKICTQKGTRARHRRNGRYRQRAAERERKQKMLEIGAPPGLLIGPPPGLELPA